MLLAGLRPSEIRHALVEDWVGGDDPKLTVRGRVGGRTIRVAPTAARAVDTYLAGEDAKPDEPLLVGLDAERQLARAVRRTTQWTGLDVGVHDLRRAAIAAVLEDGTPCAHIEAYFGLSRPEGRRVVPVREGYDRGITAMLEATFAN
jgi:integrase